MIDVATEADGASSLADDSTAEELRDELPEQRLAEAYLSEEGVAGDRRRSWRARLAGALRLAGRESRSGGGADRDRGRASSSPCAAGSIPSGRASEPGFFAAFPDFEASLPELLPGRSLAYLGFGDPGATVRALLAQASAQAPGVAAGFEQLVSACDAREGSISSETCSTRSAARRRWRSAARRPRPPPGLTWR